MAAWRRFPAQPDSILWTLQADPGKIGEFARQLEGTGALEKEYAGGGNVSTRITYSLPDSAYTWSWSNAGPPEELEQWYDEVRQFCEDLNAQRQQGANHHDN